MIMMVVLPIILLILSFLVEGVCLQFMGQLIATVLFCLRRFGFEFKLRTIFTWEGLATFATQITALLLKHFSFKEFILIAVLRGIFIFYVMYCYNTYSRVTITVSKEELTEYDKKGEGR